MTLGTTKAVKSIFLLYNVQMRFENWRLTEMGSWVMIQQFSTHKYFDAHEKGIESEVDNQTRMMLMRHCQEEPLLL